MNEASRDTSDGNIAQSSPFRERLRSRSSSVKSRLILALDLGYTDEPGGLVKKARETIEATHELICGVKLNLHLIVPLSLSELRSINQLSRSLGLVSIADIKLNDIRSTNEVACRYLWKCNFSAVIVNPFVGYGDGLDIVFEEARSAGKGVITLAYMSHTGADEGYGMQTAGGSSMFELFLDKARTWRADGIVVGATRPDIIAASKRKLGSSGISIFSPGLGAQGGNAVAALEAGADYLIYGRQIVDSSDQRASVRNIHASMLPWTEAH